MSMHEENDVPSGNLRAVINALVSGSATAVSAAVQKLSPRQREAPMALQELLPHVRSAPCFGAMIDSGIRVSEETFATICQLKAKAPQLRNGMLSELATRHMVPKWQTMSFIARELEVIGRSPSYEKDFEMIEILYDAIQDKPKADLDSWPPLHAFVARDPTIDKSFIRRGIRCMRKMGLDVDAVDFYLETVSRRGSHLRDLRPKVEFIKEEMQIQDAKLQLLVGMYTPAGEAVDTPLRRLEKHYLYDDGVVEETFKYIDH